jgi:hypothetical protein
MRFAATDSEKAVHNAIEGIKQHFETLHKFGLNLPDVTKLFSYSASYPDKPLELYSGIFNRLAEQANKK